MSDSATVRSVQTPVNNRARFYAGRVKDAMRPLQRMLKIRQLGSGSQKAISTSATSIAKPPVRATRPEALNSELIQNPELAQILAQIDESENLGERSSEISVAINPVRDSRSRRRKSSLVKLSPLQKISGGLKLTSLIRRFRGGLTRAELPRQQSISLSRASLIRRRKKKDLLLSALVVLLTVLLMFLIKS